ncbi:LysR family transcriptional regulator [Alsobacter metallidurans]|nr:LysR family transcriptional regulator [Alsobacter metallidurans]
MSRFDWDDLRFFLAVARAGRLTVAARRLGADHATVSRRITSLETALKATLFERRPQGYTLTGHGERLVIAAEAIESAALAASSDIGGADLALSGTVRVGAPDGFGTSFLAPRTVKLAETYPELEFQLVAMPRLLSLSKREADIAISLSPPKEGKIVARKLTDYRLGLYASRAYLEAAEPIRAPDDLFSHPLVGYIDDLIFMPELDYLDEIAKGLRPRLQSSSLVAQMEATLAGAGVCVLPHFMTARRAELAPVLPHIQLTRTFWLIVHAELKDVARVRAMVDFLVREVKAARGLFLPEAVPLASVERSPAA